MRLPRGVRISTLLFAGAIIYFAVNLFVGQQGVLSWRVYVEKADALEQEKAELEARKALLETRVARLQPKGADADLIEERAFQQLGLARPEAVLVRLDTPATQ